MTFVFTLLLTIFCLGTALVLGGTAAIAFATAPQLHKALASRQAGAVFERILHVFDRVGFGGAWAAALSAAFIAVLFPHAGIRWWLETAIMVIVALAYLSLMLIVAPGVKEVAPPRDDDAEDTRTDEEKREFQQLHRIYVRLYSLNLFMATAAFVILAMPSNRLS